MLTLKRVKQLLCKYILVRWSKKVKRKHYYIKSSYAVIELKPKMERFDKLCRHVYDVAEVVVDFDDATNGLHHTLDGFMANFQSMPSLVHHNLSASFRGEEIMSNLGNNCENLVSEIRSLLCVTQKGWPSSKRKLSQVEKIGRKLRKQGLQIVENLFVEVCVYFFVLIYVFPRIL